jgi:hypothetical protein
MNRSPVSPRKRRTRPPRPRKRASASQQANMNTPNLANIISSFLTFRSTVKDLSTSLHRLENIMDNTYQMFELAHSFLDKKNSPRRRRSPLRLIKPSKEEEIPRLNLPPLEKESGISNSQLSRFFEGIDIAQVLKLLQTPFVQQILSRIIQGASTSDTAFRKQKQG